MRTIFVREGRLRSGWRVLTFIVVYALLLLLASILLAFALASYLVLTGVQAAELRSGIQQFFGEPAGFFLLELVQLALTLAVVFFWRRWIDKRSFSSLGLQRSPGWAKDLILGAGLIASTWVVIFAVALVFSAVSVANIHLDLASLAGALVLGLILNLMVGLNEELQFRGYILTNLAEGVQLAPAILISSVLFGGAHLLNPGASFASTLGVAIAGVLFGLAYATTGRLWMPIGMHAAWNLFEGPVFGFPVSGLHFPTLLELRVLGPEWLTGGPFGPEAGALTIVPLVLLVLGFYVWGLKGRGLRIPRQAPN